MRVGVVFPQYEIGSDPSVLRDYAQQAEDLGYSHLLGYDHVLGADPAGRTPPLTGPYTHEHAFHEPLTLFAFLSGVTSSIGLTTGVLVLPQRQTALAAKQVAEVALLSRGRLRLGVGVGWNPVEYQALGAQFSIRGRLLENQVALLRALLRNPTVEIHDGWHRVDRAGILPRPTAHVPIWFGGFADAALRRAAEIGDGFLFSRRGGRRGGEGGTEPIGVSIARAAELREQVARLGREPDEFGIEGRSNYADGPIAWDRELDEFQAGGFDYVAVNMLDSGLDSPRDHLAALTRYAHEVGLTDRLHPTKAPAEG